VGRDRTASILTLYGQLDFTFERREIALKKFSKKELASEIVL
jgi:hypothetical protein